MSAPAFSGRTEQYKTSLQRAEDARKLREANRWRGAMYLLGYAVECALKAKLMERYGYEHLRDLQAHLHKRFRRDIDVFTHSLPLLMTWTEGEARISRTLRRPWGETRKWQVAWRYDPQAGTEKECGDFFSAAEHVLRFIERSV